MLSSRLLRTLESLQIKARQHFHPKLNVSGLYNPAIEKYMLWAKNLTYQVPASNKCLCITNLQSSPFEPIGQFQAGQAEMEAADFQGMLHLHQSWVSELHFTPLTRQASLPVGWSHLNSRQTAACTREDCSLAPLVCCSKFSL